MTQNSYFAVQWLHDVPDAPVTLFSELDDERMETRKVEVFRDGRKGFADARDERGGTRLGEKPTPSLAEIAEDPQFRPSEITRDEFDQQWALRETPNGPVL